MITQTMPTLVGHRGWPARYPENTLDGFAAAVDAGARWLECDVQVSADGVPFVCHDVSLQRTAGLARNITDMPGAELAVVNVGERQRFGERFVDLRLPRLDALIAWLAGQAAVTLFVEIKQESLRHHGSERVVANIMQTIGPALAQCVVISFDHACLALARDHGAPAIGWALEHVTGAQRATAGALQPDYLFTDEAKFTAVRAALPGAWYWAAYHTENVARALELADQGAALVETNDIGSLLHAAEFGSHD